MYSAMKKLVIAASAVIYLENFPKIQATGVDVPNFEYVGAGKCQDGQGREYPYLLNNVADAYSEARCGDTCLSHWEKNLQGFYVGFTSDNQGLYVHCFCVFDQGTTFGSSEIPSGWSWKSWYTGAGPVRGIATYDGYDVECYKLTEMPSHPTSAPTTSQPTPVPTTSKPTYHPTTTSRPTNVPTKVPTKTPIINKRLKGTSSPTKYFGLKQPDLTSLPSKSPTRQPTNSPILPVYGFEYFGPGFCLPENSSGGTSYSLAYFEEHHDTRQVCGNKCSDLELFLNQPYPLRGFSVVPYPDQAAYNAVDSPPFFGCLCYFDSEIDFGDAPSLWHYDIGDGGSGPVSGFDATDDIVNECFAVKD